MKYLFALLILSTPTSAQTVVSILSFGGDPTSRNDSTPAWNAACAAVGQNGGTIYLPAGTYQASSTWTCSSASPLSVRGDGSMLSFIKPSHTGIALTLALGNVGRHTSVEGIGFIPGASTAASAALQVTYPEVSSYPYETTLIRDVQVEASPTDAAQMFMVGAKLNGLWQSRIQGFAYWGGPSAQPVAGTHGVEIGHSFDITFEDFRAYSADIGIDQVAYSESLHLVRPDFIGGNFGFKNQIDTAGPRNNFSGFGLFVRDGECDVYVACVALNQFYTGFIDDNRIALRSGSPGSAGIDLLDTRQVHVGYNSFQAPTILADATGLHIHQEIGYGKQNRVDGFSCFAGRSCVKFGVGTSLNVAINLVSFQPTDLTGAGDYGVGFCDDGDNNFIQGIIGAGYTSKTTGSTLRDRSNHGVTKLTDIRPSMAIGRCAAP